MQQARGTMRPFALFAIINAICHSGQAFQIGTKIGASIIRSPTLITPSRSIISATVGSQSPTILRTTPTQLFAKVDGITESSSSKAEAILESFHKSNLLFRIVVIGNGAILETTSKLGPVSKSSISPKSGERLLTFASEDKTFEFHVKVEQVCTIAFVAGKRRVARFLNENGTPICSLILVDEASGAEEWFDGLVEKYGNEVVM